MTKITKRAKKSAEAVDREAFYSLADAIKIIEACAKESKFDETVELAINLNIDPRHSDQIVRGMMELPHGTGKSVKVMVFARDDKAAEAEAAGADLVGSEELAQKIQSGEVSLNDIDRCIATPDMMPVLGRLGKILGPKGLMPNPKLGTVTPDVKKAVESAKGGSVEFRAEKSGIVHAGVGKASFGAKKIEENARAFIEAIRKARPTGAKGTYVGKVTITSTMGPGVKLDLEELVA